MQNVEFSVYVYVFVYIRVFFRLYIEGTVELSEKIIRRYFMQKAREVYLKITANGKTIDTHLLKNLLIQGEKSSETIAFVVDRYYSGYDLSECQFFIKGVTEKDEEAQQGLILQTSDEKLMLIWNISENFTVTSGVLTLEIRAVLLSDDNETPQVILKYDMAPIFIKPSPIGSNAPMPDTVEQAINSIATVVTEGLNEIQALIDSFNLDALNARLDVIEADLKELLSRPVIQPITKADYDTSAHTPNVLYIITEE